MKHFYGKMSGANTRTLSAYGTRTSGLTTRAITRDGEITVALWHDESRGKDRYEINLEYFEKKVIHKIQLAAGFF